MSEVELTPYDLDLTVACPHHACGAELGQACKGLAPGIAHFGRRLVRMCAGFAAECERERADAGPDVGPFA